MPIDHSSCAHPRTPAGRAACRRAQGGATPTKQRPERPVGTSRERHPSDASYWRRGGRTDALKALNEAPARVRVFIERCKELGFEITAKPVEVGHSIEVYSSRGAGRVTWEGERVSWFTRLGHTSITSRVTSFREVWAVLGASLDD